MPPRNCSPAVPWSASRTGSAAVCTCIDPRARFAFAWASTRSSSRAAYALRLLSKLAPIRYLLSDNGSESLQDLETERKRCHNT